MLSEYLNYSKWMGSENCCCLTLTVVDIWRPCLCCPRSRGPTLTKWSLSWPKSSSRNSSSISSVVWTPTRRVAGKMRTRLRNVNRMQNTLKCMWKSAGKEEGCFWRVMQTVWYFINQHVLTNMAQNGIFKKKKKSILEPTSDVSYPNTRPEIRNKCMRSSYWQNSYKNCLFFVWEMTASKDYFLTGS